MEAKYAKLYPTSCGGPSFYGLLKFQTLEAGVQFVTIVPIINSLTNECASCLADILGTVIKKVNITS